MKRLMTISTLAIATAVASQAVTAETITTANDDMLKDDMYVTISGVVGEIKDSDEFQLIYNGGTIMVDTNDKWPNLFTHGAENTIKSGDKVRVTGEIDDNLFEKKEIEATSVSHEGTNYSRMYWTEETNNWPYDRRMGKSFDDREISLTGYISAIEDDNEFVLNYESGTIDVETEGLNITETNTLNIGDRVTVYGEIDKDLFAEKELEANRIYRLDYYGPRV